MQTHTVLGEQMLSGVAVLHGEGLRVVRSHHERWDGKGYPDGLGETEVPLGARVFAVADALDAMTSDRPYRRALRWSAARDEIVAQAGSSSTRRSSRRSASASSSCGPCGASLQWPSQSGTRLGPGPVTEVRRAS